ncbi:GbpC/Spa domain-containing protein [Streptococcus hyointestinalis]|uniref:GbpC/Spa domain-containing protein n=1 Tax=Streptococcus hyointestinalis TaxID=1337 RepID=UPI00351783DF
MKRELNRFSFRKTKAFGLCSAAIAVFILANGANSAFADDVQSDNSDNLTLVDSSTADSSDASNTAESTTVSVPESAISYDENDAYVPSEVEEAIVQAVTEVKAAGGEVEVVEDEPIKLAYDEYYDTEEKVASIKEDTKTYLDALSTYQKEQESYQEEKANYDETIAQLNADYQDALTKYHNELAKYQEDLDSYNEAKSAYEAYVAEVKAGGQAAVETVQKLTFTTEPNAIVTVAGISKYLTKEAVERLGQSGMWAQYTSGNVSANDLTTSSPYQNDEDQWAYIKEGDSYTVTYTNLTNSAYEDSAIKKVVYHYHLNSSTASDGQAIVRIHRDPTTTATMGASTDDTSKSLSMDVTVQFFDADDNELAVGDRNNAIISINSLNHWEGAAYVTSEKPGLLTLETRAIDGTVVRSQYNPYEGDLVPSADGGRAVSRSQLASTLSFTDDNGEVKVVNISEDNPLAIVVDNQASSASSVYASGAANGYTTSTGRLTCTMMLHIEDVLGVYTIDPATGLITYTPEVKYDGSHHIERVGIGNNQFIKIPGSSITLQDGEAYAVNDNQYIAHGATFNGESSGQASDGIEVTGWDSQSSPYYYYGGAGVLLDDAHLTFSVDGNQEGDTSVFWFAINSVVSLPKLPGNPPQAPVAPEKPVYPDEPEKPSSQKPETLTLYYEAILDPTIHVGDVLVHYVDEDGTVLKEPVVAVEEDFVGAIYDTSVHRLATITVDKDSQPVTYNFIRVQTGDKEVGEIVEGTMHVTYIYKKVVEPVDNLTPKPTPEPSSDPTPPSLKDKTGVPVYQAPMSRTPRYHKPYTAGVRELPKTGDKDDTASFTLFGATLLAATLGLAPLSKKSKP